eukprot:7389413-Prymnesium_polylepis.3
MWAKQAIVERRLALGGGRPVTAPLGKPAAALSRPQRHQGCCATRRAPRAGVGNISELGYSSTFWCLRRLHGPPRS